MNQTRDIIELIGGYVAGGNTADTLHHRLAEYAKSLEPVAPDQRGTCPATDVFAGADESAPKQFRNGTHRLIPPEETLARLRQLMPAMGITRIANITGLDVIGIPVVMVCRPNSRSLAVSQGKGLNLAAAEASGLMESVEAYHAERIALPLTLGSYDELRSSHRMIDVRGLPRVTDSLYRPAMPLLWIEGYDLVQRQPTWLPYEVVHTNYVLPPPTGSGCFPETSNGLASGNHRLEAISHAICEVVERDAWTLWSLLPEPAQDRTRLDLDTVDDVSCLEVLDKYKQATIAVAVWEMTTEVGIPAFCCLITARSADPLHPLPTALGMGCHPTRGIALLRALTEAAQSRLTVIAGSRDDVQRRFYEQSRSLDVLQRHRDLTGSRHHMRRFQDVPTWDAETFNDDVAFELERLQAAGIEQVVVVDLTKPEFGVPVVRVVIPGLEGDGPLHPNYQYGARARALMEGRS
ncbi:MAG: YcaO-like family protein [Dehalococcoidia bacterium]